MWERRANRSLRDFRWIPVSRFFGPWRVRRATVTIAQDAPKATPGYQHLEKIIGDGQTPLRCKCPSFSRRVQRASPSWRRPSAHELRGKRDDVRSIVEHHRGGDMNARRTSVALPRIRAIRVPVMVMQLIVSAIYLKLRFLR